jgi:hypothetical protein
MNTRLPLIVCILISIGTLSHAGTLEDITALLRSAGNADDESDRYRLLNQLAARKDLDPALWEDLAKILPVVDAWANGKHKVVVDRSRAAENGYLCRFITGRIQPEGYGAVYPPPLSRDSLLRPIWCLYRGRMLIWRPIQSSPLLRVEDTRDAYYGEGRRLLEEAAKAFPANCVIRAYLGQPIPWRAFDADPKAPEWANLQREGLEKLTEIIHWWIDNRQLADGQFGGGWGDDVEMWRWWTPVLLGFEDPKVTAAQERISSGIFAQPHLREGFTSRLTDVEHANEDTTDTILPMMHLRPDDPLWKSRALRLAELMPSQWTGRNHRGFLQYKSIYFSVNRVDESPERAFDTVYHPSIVQPALLYWQRTADPALTELFGEWLKLWIDAAAREQNGKPPGVLPSAIRWPDGGIAFEGHAWWRPFSPGHNDALYNWPGATRLMTSTLLLAYHMTRDEQYLHPIHSMAAIRLKHMGSRDAAPEGSEAWCAQNMGSFLPDTLAKLRVLTGDERYDALLRSDASGYVRYRLTEDIAPLTTALRRGVEAFRSNRQIYTDEMRWTDRVMSFTKNYLQYLPEPAPAAPSPDIFYATATGDPGNPLIFPLNAVRWLTEANQIAALVTDSSRTTLRAELYHFGQSPRVMGAVFYLLEPGRYRASVIEKNSSKKLAEHDIAVTGPQTQVRFVLPPRTHCELLVEKRT